MFMSTWTTHRPRRRAPLVLSRSECRLGRLARSLRTLSRLWQSTQAVLLAALARVSGGAGGGWPICCAGRGVGRKKGKTKARINFFCHLLRGGGGGGGRG